jgi:hypothetical protein
MQGLATYALEGIRLPEQWTPWGIVGAVLVGIAVLGLVALAISVTLRR